MRIEINPLDVRAEPVGDEANPRLTPWYITVSLEGSKLPPRVQAKIMRLDDEDRKLYCQERLGAIKVNLEALDRLLRQYHQQWAQGQREHLVTVEQEYYQLLQANVIVWRFDDGD